VLATGETHSVREFAEKVFASLDLDYKQYVEYDAKYERPAEVDLLLGDATKAKQKLGWEPKVGFDQLVKMMVDADLVLAKEEKAVAEHKARVGRGES
jgi:GDPmannose 4,6-dehydratase